MIERCQIQLKFKNSKEAKDIHIFAKTLSSMDEYLRQNSKKRIYIRISEEAVELASKIQKVFNPLEKTGGAYLCKLKPPLYKLQHNCGKSFKTSIYQIDVQFLLFALNSHIQPKISVLFLKFTDNFLHIRFTAGDQIEQITQLAITKLNQQEWPSLEGRIICPLGQISDQICKKIYGELCHYIECTQDGITLLNINGKGQITYQHKLNKKNINHYDYISIKKELKLKTLILINSKHFFKHLVYTYRNKLNCKISFILTPDLLNQSEIKAYHMMLVTQSQKLDITKFFSIDCETMQSMKFCSYSQNPITTYQRRPVNDPLLKRQDDPAQVRRVILNKITSFSKQQEIAQITMRQKNIIYGKLQQNSENQGVSRKRKFEL